MPGVDEPLGSLQHLSAYSPFDFADVSLHIPMHPDERHKTMFYTCSPNVQFSGMLFGLVNAPAELRNLAGWLDTWTMHVNVPNQNGQKQLQHL